MKLITLAKRLDFESEYDYFNYCRDSYINGNFSQCKELFNAMTKKDKKALINFLTPSKNVIDSIDHEVYQYYLELL
jgi:catalase